MSDPLLEGIIFWSKQKVDLQAVGREKERVKERDEAMSEQGEQVVWEGQDFLVLDLEQLEQGVDPQEGTLQIQ